MTSRMQKYQRTNNSTRRPIGQNQLNENGHQTLQVEQNRVDHYPKKHDQDPSHYSLRDLGSLLLIITLQSEECTKRLSVTHKK